MMNDFDYDNDDFLDDLDVLDELDELDLDEYHLEVPLEELDPVVNYDKHTLKPSLADMEAMFKAGDTHNLNLIQGLSDLTTNQADSLRTSWQSVETEQRQLLVQRLIEASEADYMFDYRAFAMMSLDDVDADVRALAIELLWDDNNLETMHKFIYLAQNDKAIIARASAVAGLGHFILQGEFEELDPADVAIAHRVALDIWNNRNEPTEVRRRALEAISHSSRENLPSAITEAYQSPLVEMQMSAIFAMGKSYDSQWHNIVLKELDNENPRLRYEAVQAAGELEMKQAIQSLGKLARDETDREIMLMAIWALGEIGGTTATKILNRLAERAEDAEDDDLIETIEDALAISSLGDIDIQ